MAESYTSPTMVNGAAVDAALANGNAAQAAHADQRIFGFLPAGPVPTLSWDEATWTLTLTGAPFSYYRNSVKYLVATNKSVTLPGAPPASGMWWVRIAGNDGTLSASQTPWTLGPTDSDVTVCSIEINNALTPKSHLYTELHPCDMNRGMHRYEHLASGPKLISGGVVSGYTLAGNTTAANTFGVSQAYYMDETLGVTVTALVDDDGATLKYLVRSRLAGAFTWTQSLVPYLYAPGGYIQWDNAGTLTAATANNRYINTYLLATQAGWQLVVGQASHTSLAAAQAETFQSLSLTGLQLADYIAVAQLTWRTGSYGGLGLCRLEAFAKITVSSITVGNSTGLPAPHASTHDATGSDPLTGYALTSADLADFTSGAATSGQVPTADGAGGVAWTAQGVTNGNSHDHSGGDGAPIAYSGLSGLPTLGTAATMTGPSGTIVGTTDTQTLSAKTITALKETKTTSSSYNFDLAAGNYFTHTASANNLTVSNVPATGTVASFIIELTNGGASTFSFWSGVKWAGGTVPTLTASGVDILGFYTHDGGTTWRGLLLAKDSK